MSKDKNNKSNSLNALAMFSLSKPKEFRYYEVFITFVQGNDFHGTIIRDQVSRFICVRSDSASSVIPTALNYFRTEMYRWHALHLVSVTKKRVKQSLVKYAYSAYIQSDSSDKGFRFFDL